MALERHRAEALSLGIATVKEMIDGRPVEMKHIVCSVCGGSISVRHKPDAPPEQILQHFEQKGWRFHKQWRCSVCFNRRRTRKEHEMAEMKNAQAQAAVVVPIRPATVLEVIRVSKALGGNFMEGRFVNGFTDRRIADDLKLPIALVAKVREEHPEFGPLKEHPEITALSSNIDAVRSMLTDIEAEFARLRTKLG